MSQVLITLILMVGMISSLAVSGQSKEKNDLDKHMPTGNISMWQNPNKSANRPKRKKINFLYKKTGDGVLYGNPCAQEATHRIGLEYVIQPPSLYGSPFEGDMVRNNIWVNVKLIFTKSPFWKLILNRKIKECRDKSGDIVG